jgi:hypothetical protein
MCRLFMPQGRQHRVGDAGVFPRLGKEQIELALSVAKKDHSGVPLDAVPPVAAG